MPLRHKQIVQSEKRKKKNQVKKYNFRKLVLNIAERTLIRPKYILSNHISNSSANYTFKPKQPK